MLNVAAVVLSLYTAQAGEPIRIAAPGLRMVNLDPKQTSFFTSSFAQVLNFQGVRVSTPEDFAALLGLERQQQLLGCPDDVCRAEVTGELGVDGLLVGQVAKVDGSYRLDVKLLASGTGRPLAAASTTAPDQERLLASFNDAAAQLAAQVSKALGRPLVKGEGGVRTRWSTVKRLMWLPLTLGVAGAVTGGVLLGSASGQYGQLTQQGRALPLTPDQTAAFARDGKQQQTVGWVAVGVGAALLATAGAMLLFGGDETLSAGVALAPGGAGLSIAGVW